MLEKAALSVRVQASARLQIPGQRDTQKGCVAHFDIISVSNRVAKITISQTVKRMCSSRDNISFCLDIAGWFLVVNNLIIGAEFISQSTKIWEFVQRLNPL